LTGHFEALPLTIAAAAAAYSASVLLTHRSILTEKIARRGRHILHEYTVDPLDLVQAGQLMTRAPATLPGSMSVADALTFFRERGAYRSYPVVDDEGRLLGLVSRMDALRWQSGDVPNATLAETLSDISQPVAYPDSPSGVVADLIIESGIGRIPIVEPATRRVVGIVSRQDLLQARRAHRAAETQRSGYIGATAPAAPPVR